MIEHALEVFNKYTDNYDKNSPLIESRYRHSISVMNLMNRLAIKLNLSNEYIELAKLIGLLHDIGRFDQIKKYNSCSDSKTGMDHASYGCDYLFKENHIRDFITSDKYDNIINVSIYNHNKFKIEDHLNKDELLFSKMIRDMDKLDIFKEDALCYQATFNKDELKEELLDTFMQGKLVDTRKIKSESDSILASTCFIFDINFDESKILFNETKYFNQYLDSIIIDDNSINLWNKIKNICLDNLK